ncbi:GDP dissociation inhibitor-domain-containing protein [Dipodascopsis tothii]|uniref:GDP dissociation inhibitor-domain-containing protein n=1 Tax=Dipodascopsis tothii TaxID=44089 RepID=UPI0034CD800B
MADVANPAPSGADSCDVLISGTGLVESILAAALAWQGSRVVHLDSNGYYGGAWAALNLDELRTWVDRVNAGASGADAAFADAYLYISRNLESRKYAVDLSPHVLFTRSDLLSLLIKSRVSRYLEFKPVGSFHTFEQDSFEKVPGTKEDIFTSQTLTLLTKRSLMRFIKFVAEYETSPAVWTPYRARSISTFLAEKFRLEPPQIVELVHSIGLCVSPDVPTEDALAKIKRYLVSMQVFGNFPAVYSMYGTAGELAQGFCRSSAVAGSTYRLGTAVTAFDAASGVATLDTGEKLTVTEKYVTSAGKTGGAEVTRMVAIVEKDCAEWFAEGESAAVVIFPPGTLDGNKYAVQVLVMGSGSGQCPTGQAIWYLSTVEPGDQGRKELYLALEKMEEAILRESTEDFELDVGEEDILYLPNGLPTIKSVRLGESLRNFVPKEALKYLLKLSYSQTTGPAPAGAGRELFTAAPGIDISFDGAVAEARALYEAVTGAQDDFFDVDFEDDDDGAPADAGSDSDHAEVAGEMTI